MKTTEWKDTEIGRIPKDWEVKPIGEIFTFKNGLNKGKEFFGEGTPIINYTDVYHKRSLVAKDIKGKVTLSSDEIKRFEVKKGDMFFTRTSETPEEVGIASVLLEDIPSCVFSGFVLRARPINDSLFPDYCGYGFSTKQIRKDIVNNCTFTTRALTNGQVLSSIKIPLLPISEQQRIANALSDIDMLITSLDKAIEKKRMVKQGAMQQMLTGNKRLKGFTEGWKIKRIGDIGYTYNGLTGKSKGDFGVGTAHYVTFLNILNNPIIDTALLEKVNVALNEKQNEVRKGDLFFNTSSETPEEVGICATIDVDIDELYLNSFCFGFRLTDRDILSDYLAYYFRSSIGRQMMTMLAQGATRYNLSKDNFLKCRLLLPGSLVEQQAIIDVLSIMDGEISSITHEREKYLRLKEGMMQELLTGKTRLI